MNRAGKIWTAYCLVIALVAGVAVAQFPGHTERISAPSGSSSSVTAPATGAGTDTCTGSGCAIGAAGISTDAGVTVVKQVTSNMLDFQLNGDPTHDTSYYMAGAGNGVWAASGNAVFQYGAGGVSPFANNTMTLGTTSLRWTGVWSAGAFDSSIASGSVAIQTLTGAKTCDGTAAVTCSSSDGTTTTFDHSVAVAAAKNFSNPSFTGTAASGTGITANATSVIRNWVHKVTVINTALAAAATSDVTLHVTPVNTRIVRVVADVTQVFTGGSLSAMTITCGNSAGGNQYLLSNSVFTATNVWGDVVAEMGAGVVSSTLADFGTVASGVPGAITVQCRFTCTGANCSAATQGSVTFYVEGVTYP